MGKLTKEYKHILLITIVLIFPAYLINVKQLPLIPDESIRTLVALEMKLSGDYITPTLGGEFYFKKPPVYNWLIAGYMNLTGDYSELASRVPMLISLLLFSLTIFLITKKRYGFRTGFLAAMLYMLLPRITVYESLYGLIDLTYSWIVFVTFISIYHYFEKERYLTLFLVSYTLTALSFLLKGIPSIAYQGITLLLVFTLNQKFKKLFSWQHLVGVLPLVVILGVYYGVYYFVNGRQMGSLLNTLFHESADKSAIAFGLWDILKHSASYTLQVFYSFIPATFVLFFLFNKGALKYLKTDRFIAFLLYAFVGNYLIYMVSPISFMRYVLPHVALLIVAFVVLYQRTDPNNKLIRFFDRLFLIATYVICISPVVFLFIPRLNFIDHRWLKIIVLSGGCLAALIWLQKKRQYRLELFIIAILFFKLSFNLFIIPERVHENFKVEERERSLKAGELMCGKKAVVCSHSLITTTLYYLTAGKQELIPYSNDTTNIAYLIGTEIPFDISGKIIVDEYQVGGLEYNVKIVKW